MKKQLLTLLAFHLGLAALVAQPVIPPNEPADQTAIAGSMATFSVNATGTPPLTNQWRRITNSTAYGEIPGATNNVFVLTNAQVISYRFALVVSDSTGSRTSRLARLTVGVPAAITSQNGDVSAVAGESFTLGVTATGTTPLSFRWSFNGLPLSGATSSNLTFPSIQFSNAGAYQVVVTNLYGVDTSRVATLTVVPPTLFTRVTNGPVATTPRQGFGTVWADFNNDGWLDLYAVDFGTGTNQYFRNDGNGNFTQLPQGSSMNTGIGSKGTSAVDYDNDGYLDLVVSSAGANSAPLPNSLFHNNGDGTFTRVTAGGLGSTIGHFFATDWADYDNDGFVDALITGSGPLDNNGNSLSGTNQLWHNNGDGTFSQVTAGPIATDRGFPWGALWFDYDSDGRPDLLTLNIQNNGGRNYLYHNEGNGVFSRNLTNPIGTDFLSVGGAGADWGDYDNDGLLDLFVPDAGGAGNHLYHNNGGGSFSNVTAGPILTPPAGSEPRANTWGDYDNDGYLDLVVAHRDRNVLYRNDRNGSFTEVRLAGFANDTLVSDSYFFINGSWVDYDNDGFLDLHFSLGRRSDRSDPIRPSYLYQNGGNSNGWLEVKCEGTVANRSAIGTRIRVKATIAGKTFWQIREIKSGVGVAIASPLVAHFGLGDATTVETLRLEWPSGTVQELTNVAPRQILPITEPPRLTATRVSGQPQFTLKGGRNMTYGIEGSTNLRDWSPVNSVTVTNMAGMVPITDPGSGAHRFYRAVAR